MSSTRPREQLQEAEARREDLIYIPPDQIEPNRRNPRQIFPPEEIEELAESIASIGVQVPITVYRREGGDHPPFVLLDGERRWRACTLIDYAEVPAFVVEEPTGLDNTIRMFNIHMLRRDWDEMPTAWALERLMDELGTDSTAELSRRTGLSRDRIRNMKIALKFPREIQNAVAAGEEKFNRLVELWKATQRAEKKEEPPLGMSAQQLLNVFLERSNKGMDTDVVEYRKLGRLVATALEDSPAGEAAEEALDTLVHDHEYTIEDAYHDGAATSIQHGKVMRDIQKLPGRLDRVLRSDPLPEQKVELLEAITGLCKELEDFLEKHG